MRWAVAQVAVLCSDWSFAMTHPVQLLQLLLQRLGLHLLQQLDLRQQTHLPTAQRLLLATHTALQLQAYLRTSNAGEMEPGGRCEVAETSDTLSDVSSLLLSAAQMKKEKSKKEGGGRQIGRREEKEGEEGEKD